MSSSPPPSGRSRYYWGNRLRIRINRKFLEFCRTIHVYLSMLGLLVMFLFGLTGFTINHEDWFGANVPRVSESEARMPVELIAKKDPLQIVEHLRGAHHISGAMTAFDDFDDRYSIGFKEPGQIWEIEVEKAGGLTKIHHETFNLAAVINNLHRGRYSGPGWSWIIDVSAIMVVVACGTGIVLWLALPRRRVLGAFALVLGIAGTLAIYHWLVPGPDARVVPPKGLAQSPSGRQ